MATAIHLLAIIIVAFLSRAWPRFFRPRATSSDTWYHLVAAERIRENHFRLPERLRGLVFFRRYDYPPLFHYLLALFSRDTRERIEPYTGAIIDSLHVMILYFFARYISVRPELAQYALNPPLVSLLAAIVFITAPSLINVGTGPGAFQATPRPLTQLFVSLSIMFATIFYLESSLGAALLSVFWAALTLLTSKFGAQVLLFLSIFMTLFLRSPLFLALPPLAVLIALAFSKGHYWWVLKAHVSHLRHYHKYKGNYISSRNRLKDLKSLPQDLLTNPGKAFRTIYLYNTFTIFLLDSSLYLLLLALLILDGHTIFSSPSLAFLSYWTLSCLAIFVLISLPPLAFLGQAERYFQFGVPALGVVLGCYLLIKSDPVWWSIFLLLELMSVAVIIVNYYVFLKIIKSANLSNKLTTDELLTWLNGLDGSLRILPIPVNCPYAMIAYYTNHEALLEARLDRFPQFCAEYPYPLPDLRGLASRYNFNLILCQKYILEKIEREKKWRYDFSSFDKVFENEDYYVYRV